MTAMKDKSEATPNPIPFKCNERVILNGSRGTVRACSRTHALVEMDGAKKGSSLARVPVENLEKSPFKDIPTNQKQFDLGYLDGIYDHENGQRFSDGLTGSSYSIGYRKGYEDSAKGNIRSCGNDPFIECGGVPNPKDKEAF